MRDDRFELALGVAVVDPVPGLAIALQTGGAGASELIAPHAAGNRPISFMFDVTVEGSLADGRPRLLGRVVQGPPGARFVYLCVGQYAGQSESPWSGRVKVPLSDLSWDSIRTLQAGQRLWAEIPGRGRNGGPALASVKLLEPGWTVGPA